jgi:hypothetical protein
MLIVCGLTFLYNPSNASVTKVNRIKFLSWTFCFHCECRIFLFIPLLLWLWLLQDPSIKELAEQIAKDPAFRDMAKALQHNLQNDGQPDIPKFNTPAYFSSMEKIVDDPQFVNMAQRLGSTLMEVRYDISSHITY